MRKFLQTFLVTAISFSSCLFAKAQHSVFQKGDIFLGLGGGVIQWRDSNKVLIKNIVTGDAGGNGNGTGLRINPVTGKLWVANSNLPPHSPNGIRIINTDGTPGNAVDVSAYQGSPTSITFDKQGNGYIGDLWSQVIVKINPAGTAVLDHYNISTDGYVYGPEWVEIDCNDSIIYYTYLNKRVKRYNVATRQQLTDFANLTTIPGWLFAMRLLPGNGMIVAPAGKQVFRLNAAGSIVQTYDSTLLDSYFGMAANPGGKSFWAGGFAFYAPMYKFDIASGHVIDSFRASPTLPGLNVYGIAVYGDELNNCPEDIVVATATSIDTRVFPNPGNGNFTLQTNLSGAITITLYNSLGQLVFSKIVSANNGSNTIPVNASYLMSGMYYIRVSNEKETHVQKIVIH